MKCTQMKGDMIWGPNLSSLCSQVRAASPAVEWELLWTQIIVTVSGPRSVPSYMKISTVAVVTERGRLFKRNILSFSLIPLQLEIGTLLLNCSCHGYCHGFVTAAISGLLSPCLSSDHLGAFVVHLLKNNETRRLRLFSTFCAFVRSIGLNPHHFLLGSILH